MTTLRNKIITSTLIASMLLPNAAVASMHEPTTPDNLDQVVAMSQKKEIGVPTPYADISNPNVLLTTKDINHRNGGIFIDSRLPKEEWLTDLVVVHKNGHVGNVDASAYKADMKALFSNYPGWTSMSDNPVTLERATVELGAMMQKSITDNNDMTSLTLKDHDSQVARAMSSESALFALQIEMQIALMATKDANVININEPLSMMRQELYDFADPAHYEGISRYLRAGWLVHEIGHSHHHQDLLQDELVHAGSRDLSVYLKLSENLTKSETHSDAQMLLAVQTAMLANNESTELRDAYADTILRMRDANIAKISNKVIRSASQELPITVDVENHDIKFKNPDLPGTGGAIIARAKHDSTLGMYAIKALIDANLEHAASWDFSQKEKVMEAFVAAFDNSSVIRAHFDSVDDLILFSKMDDTLFKSTALDIATEMATTLSLNAPTHIRLAQPLDKHIDTYANLGFSETQSQSPHYPRMPVKNSLIFDGGDGAIKTAMIAPESLTRHNDRLLIPLSINPKVDLHQADVAMELLRNSLRKNGINMSHVLTPDGHERLSESSSGLLSITLHSPDQVSLAMSTVNDWLVNISTSSNPAYKGGHFSLNESTARLFDHTYAATFDYDGIEPDDYAKEVLLQSFNDTMTLFDTPPPHLAPQDAPSVDMAAQHKISR